MNGTVNYQKVYYLLTMLYKLRNQNLKKKSFCTLWHSEAHYSTMQFKSEEIAIYTHIIHVKSISPLSMESSGAEETNIYQESYCMDKYKTRLQF